VSADLIEMRLVELSARIKKGRENEGLTLVELGERSGVAPSTIQKIENRQMTPSIAVILKIATGLGIEPGDLIAPRNPPRLNTVLQRGGQHAKIVASKDVRFEKLSADILGSELEAWRIVIAAGCEMKLSRPQQLDEQIIFCERGHVELEFAGAGQIFKLSPGDTLHCRAQLLHRVSNTGKGEAAYMMTGRFPHSVHATFTADLNS